MPSTPATGGTAARELDEQFFELVCADADLLAAEFDAIVAAEWPSPPADACRRGPSGGRPARRTHGRPTDRLHTRPHRPRQAGTNGWVRQRSPPLRSRPVTAGTPRTTPANRSEPMTTERPDLYAVLGLAPDATQAQISHAFRTLVRRHHPDARAADDEQRVASEATLQQVLAAYTVLRDPARRADYDRQTGPRIRPARQSVPRGGYNRPPIVAGPVRWHPS